MSNICESQDNFNDAFRKAVKYVDKRNQPDRTMHTFAALIYLVFLIWAIVLVCKMQIDKTQKTIHLVLALAFPPLYVISYYVNGGM
jgi:hypothetical protein